MKSLFKKEKKMADEDAMIIVDPQFDFGDPAGPLYVPEGELVVDEINALRSHLNTDNVFITQDDHPADHVSFAANNPGSALYSTIKLPDGSDQVMWPVHCVSGSPGAAFLARLVIKDTDVIVPKGQKKETDSYSGFGSADGKQEVTPLLSMLKARNVKRVFICGLALDYCVAYTAKDARLHGFETYVVLSACRGVASDSSLKEMQLMLDAGAKLLPNVATVPV